MTVPNLSEIKARAEKATPGPWCAESCGEKGDGANMIGVAFGPDDEQCLRPLTGWLAPYSPDGMTEIEYYRDEEVAACDHQSRNPGYDAIFIAHARQDIPDLIAECEAQAARIKELENKLARIQSMLGTISVDAAPERPPQCVQVFPEYPQDCVPATRVSPAVIVRPGNTKNFRAQRHAPQQDAQLEMQAARIKELEAKLAEPVNLNSEIGREFAESAYRSTGGPTKDLKRVHGLFVENERRTKQDIEITDDMVERGARAMSFDRSRYPGILTNWDRCLKEARAILTAALQPGELTDGRPPEPPA